MDTDLFDGKSFCSPICARKYNGGVICRHRGCNRLVRNEFIVVDPHATELDFNTRDFCSKECYWAIDNDPSDDDTDGSTADTILITCSVCADDKPIKKYLVDDDDKPSADSLSSRIPRLCRLHILANMNERVGICIDCINNYVYVQFRDLGPTYISCIHEHPADEVPQVKEEWQLLAHAFLPKKLHKEYDRLSTNAWLMTVEKWVCPNGCYTLGKILDPNDTPGYPRVYCSACIAEFCARCRVSWHWGITCSQYVARHPEVLSKDEEILLINMAQVGARRCPSCHFITVKDGGCPLMMCEMCRVQYLWHDAEKVVAPHSEKENIPLNGYGYDEEQAA